MIRAGGRADTTPWETFDDVVADLAHSMETLRPIEKLSPQADFRMVGQKIPRQSHRYSGRTAIHASVSVREPGTPDDRDTPLSFSMEGYPGQPPSELITHFWAPHWNSVQSVNKFQAEVGGPLRGGDPGRRLIEPRQTGRCEYGADVPAAFRPRKGHLLVVPAYHVFGSEELSVVSTGVAVLAVKPYITVNPADAQHFAVGDGGMVEVVFAGIPHLLPVQLSPKVPLGVSQVPMGLPGLPWDGVPFWFELPRR